MRLKFMRKGSVTSTVLTFVSFEDQVEQEEEVVDGAKVKSDVGEKTEEGPCPLCVVGGREDQEEEGRCKIEPKTTRRGSLTASTVMTRSTVEMVTTRSCPVSTTVPVTPISAATA